MAPIYQDLSRFRVPPDFRGRSAPVVQLWWIVQATLFRLSPQVMYGWRRFLLRLFGASIGLDVMIRPTVKITYPWKLEIGDYSWVGDDVDLYTLGRISIGKNAVVSQRSYICTGSHDAGSIAFDIYAMPVKIEDEAWIATDVFVSPGVTIHRGCVVGARSTVLSDLPEGAMCHGTPARSVRQRLVQTQKTEGKPACDVAK